MLAVLFSVDSDRYALEAKDIIEVLPLVALKRVPPAPPYLAGLLNYHGTSVPVIDLNLLMTGTPCRKALSSRILLAQYHLPDGCLKPLGLMAEEATETARIDPDSLRPSEIISTPYLGKLAVHGAKMVQLVHPEELLTDAARALLYPDRMEESQLANPRAD